jgi:dipeptidase
VDFKKLIDYVEKNKKEYLEKELAENKRILAKSVVKESENKNDKFRKNE